MEQVSIGDNTFNVQVVTSEEDMQKGLSFTDSLPKGEGMLFDFGDSGEITMNMFDMKYPLDMVFIDDNDDVIKVSSMEPGEDTITVKNVRYVLEVNKGEAVGEVTKADTLEEGLEDDSKDENDDIENDDEGRNMIVTDANISGNIKSRFKEGGSFKLYEEEVKALPGLMHVLDDTGKVLMNIKGGERIFSIDHTEQLIAAAKKVKAGELPPEELGKIMKKFINTQNTQKPEYVN